MLLKESRCKGDSVLAYLLGVVLFAVGIAATIALHELGHLSVARWSGMRVRRYFVGFGPTLWSTQKGTTEYGVKAVPFGGFCEIAGMTALDEVTPEEAPFAMRNKPAWKRIAVLLGGIAMNILVGLTIIFGVAVTSGIPNPYADMTPIAGETVCVADRNAVGESEPCSGPGPAGAAGVKAGDRIVAVDGNKLEAFVQLRDYVIDKPGQTVTLDVLRDGTPTTIDVPVAKVTAYAADGTPTTLGAIGIVGGAIPDAIKVFSPAEAVGATFKYSGDLLEGTVKGLVQLPAKIPGVALSIFGAEREVDSPMSVVGASRVGGEFVERSLWSMFWLMLASLNFFLALFNLIPLPPFDGGHVAVVVYEKIRDAVRRLRGLPPAGPADYTRLMPLTYAIAAALLTVGVLFVVADVVNPVRLFG